MPKEQCRVLRFPSGSKQPTIDMPLELGRQTQSAVTLREGDDGQTPIKLVTPELGCRHRRGVVIGKQVIDGGVDDFERIGHTADLHKGGPQHTPVPHLPEAPR